MAGPYHKAHKAQDADQGVPGDDKVLTLSEQYVVISRRGRMRRTRALLFMDLTGSSLGIRVTTESVGEEDT